jgi:hypothetical protein
MRGYQLLTNAEIFRGTVSGTALRNRRRWRPARSASTSFRCTIRGPRLQGRPHGDGRGAEHMVPALRPQPADVCAQYHEPTGRVAGRNVGMDASTPSGAPPYPDLDAEVGPGQSLETRLVFDLPESVVYPGFALDSNLKLNPARIVIGDEDHFLHWPTVVPLD